MPAFAAAAGTHVRSFQGEPNTQRVHAAGHYYLNVFISLWLTLYSAGFLGVRVVAAGRARAASMNNYSTKTSFTGYHYHRID